MIFWVTCFIYVQILMTKFVKTVLSKWMAILHAIQIHEPKFIVLSIVLYPKAMNFIKYVCHCYMYKKKVIFWWKVVKIPSESGM